MASCLRPGEVLIHAGNANQFTDPVVNGERKARGLVPRNYAAHPPGSYASAPVTAVEMPLIDPSTYAERIADKVANKSQLSDLRLVGNAGGIIPSLDQNGKGYCWAHSSTSAVMMSRMVNNEPYVPLSAYAVACVIKSYRDEGGWGAQSLDFITERGVPSSQFWPMQSMSRSNDKPETWANAALHKVTAGWVDLASAQYDRNLTFNQVVTLLLSGVPVVGDFNWWGHSVCLLDAVTVAASDIREASGKRATRATLTAALEETGGVGVRILNSWSDTWSDRGMGVLSGSKAVPDGATAPRVTTPSVA
jgi:hypothetical protein